MTRRVRASHGLAAIALLIVLRPAVGDARADLPWPWHRSPRVTEASVRGHMEMLASDALQGRGSGTRDEQLAAVYIGSELRQWGLEPLGDDGDFVQTVETPRRGADGTPGHTWNVIGRLTGADRTRSAQVVMLSAHLDHLGVRGNGPDRIYNGADDDASGSTAVLEFARVLAAGKRPARTVLFVWFGSEETGGFGARHFIDQPPVPLASIVANLEFEMIGRPDPTVPAHTLWLTGFERTTLGDALAAKGARIVADPHPEQNFFQRSDNITLARRGVVAQTVSSFGLHHDYHAPSDDLAHIDFAHMTAAIRSLVKPILWLANASFVPQWRPGMQPPGAGPAGR
jgi:Peptidase family M28